MNYIFWRDTFYMIGTFILVLYFLFIGRHCIGLPKAYEEFMQFLIKHKSILEQSMNYFEIELDYKKRVIPKILSPELIPIVENSQILTASEINDFRFIMGRLETELDAEYCHYYRNGARDGAGFKHMHVYQYCKLSFKTNLVIIITFAVCLLTGFILTPAAKAQTLEQYQNKGIESTEDRYIERTESKEISVKIADRYYRSTFSGRNRYRFEVQLPEPFDRKCVMEVDPVLYQNKHISDTLNIDIEYRISIDRYKEKQTYKLLHVKIME